MKSDIEAIMQGELGAWLAGQDGQRAAARHRSRRRAVIAAVILVPLLGLLWWAPMLPWEVKALVTAMALVLGLVWVLLASAKVRQQVKHAINSAIAKHFGVSYQLRASPGAELQRAHVFGLVPHHDRAVIEDCWEGSLAGHDFRLYEAVLHERRRDRDKHDDWNEVFRGAIIRMAFGRPFRSTTLLERTGRKRGLMGLGAIPEKLTFNGHQLDRIDQVHPDFAETFALFSDDQVEARVLVHPAYVEHLLRLESAFASEQVRALFAEGDVVVVVEGGNRFESGGLDPRNDAERVERTVAQFTALTGLALAINQNERGSPVKAMPAA
ncbi:DUF3137 domain-containing protein [Erythrobacter cryptus]|uniref:DUF3137 domain-containing protein n=1 Tax=Erythrobacter cryptus TaxID=196588 RepID=UPI000484F8BF|nr:DUF3137 domain-containing protein [Erythrobacter cryptus]